MVDVAERPVVVAARRRSAGVHGAGFVPRAAAGGVQDADVEPSRKGIGVVERKVLANLAMGELPPCSATLSASIECVSGLRVENSTTPSGQGSDRVTTLSAS